MFYFKVLIFGLSLFVTITTQKCLERQILGYLDCSEIMLNETDQIPTERKEWVYVLDLRMNRFVSVNFMKLVLVFPNLCIVDLSDNPTLDCRLAQDPRIVIESNCEAASAILPSSIIASVGVTPPLLFTTTFTIHEMSFLPPPSMLPFMSFTTTQSTQNLFLSSTTLAVLPPATTVSTQNLSFSSTMLTVLPLTPTQNTQNLFLSSTMLTVLPHISTHTTTHGMSFSSTALTTTTPSLLPLTPTQNTQNLFLSSTMLTVLPHISMHTTTHGMSFSPTALTTTPSLLPLTTTHTTHGMSFSYTAFLKNQTTASSDIVRNSKLSILLLVIIGPSIGLIITMLVCLYIYTRRMIARRQRRMTIHEQLPSQIELLSLGRSVGNNECIASSTHTEL